MEHQMKPLAQYQELAVNKFFSLLPSGAQRILEIGSDVEYAVVDNIATRFDGTVTGINPAAGFVKRSPAEGPANVTILGADGCCMPFDDRSFDAILSIATMEHVLDIPKFLEECHRVLKPNGMFYTNFSPIWSSGIGHHVYALAGRKEARFWKPDRNPLPDFSHLLWDEDEMREYLLDSSYDDRLIEPIINWVYHSDNINRCFFEDYKDAFSAARLQVKDFTAGVYKAPSQQLLEELRAKHGQHRDFSHHFIELVMSRPVLASSLPQHPPTPAGVEGAAGAPPTLGDQSETQNVVINFHRGDQSSAESLLNLLMVVDEGIDCTYHLQYGDPPDTLLIKETIERFREKKEVVLHFDLPDITVPMAFVENDPNLAEYPGNQARRTREQKRSILQWNLCVYKFIQLLDSFLMIEPDCVILKHDWLADIYAAYRDVNLPIFGHLKSGIINGTPIPTHWAGCSVYNGRMLRELDLERTFTERYENPWWRFRNLHETSNGNNCFYGPAFSGYDISFDYFLFAHFWRKTTGSSNPFQWPVSEIANRDDLIFCDFRSTLTAAEIFNRYHDRLPVLHGVKSDESRLMMTGYFSSGGTSTMTETRSDQVAADTANHAESPRQLPQRCLSPEELFVMTNRRLGQFRNKHQGQRCVIIGNGPSLNKMDLSFLEDEITFGMNRIFLMFDQWKFRPTYYVSVNPLVIEQSAGDILRIIAPKFLSHKGIPFFDDPGDIHFLQSIPQWFFSKDPRNGICEGWTVTYVAMQLAYFMGFEEVVLIGVDHHFVTKGDPNKEVVSEGDDPNHFHPGYFGKGARWHLPDLERSEGSYRMAKETFESEGRRIIDATVDGKLTIFPKADYRELFQSKRTTGTGRQDTPAQKGAKPLLFSVITPSFNQAQFISQTIQSVQNQDYPHWEHIVMDGKSDDGTVEILKSCQHLKWLSENDRGQSDAINKGFRLATGDIIAWINSDDWYEPGAFKAVADFFTANPGKNIVMGDCNLVDADGVIFDRVINQERGFDELRKYWISRSIPTQPAIFFRRNLLDEFGLLDESLHFAMDYDLWMRFSQKNRLYHIDRTLANYRFHSDAKGGDQDWSKFIPDCRIVYDRYSPPQVSVIIPCYNYGQYLAEAVSSVITQTYQEFEIIIINDGSTDNTAEVAEQIINSNPHIRIRLINQANSGQPAFSRNKGISEAKGKYILPLDADDKISPTMIEKMVRILDDDQAVDIVYCDTIRFGDVDNAYQTEDWSLTRLASDNIINYCALFRRKVWDSVGGYRLDCGYEDWEFWISAAEKGFIGFRIPEYLFYYRIKPTGRLLLDEQNDAKNKAKIVSFHPKLYDDATRMWSQQLLAENADKENKLQVLIVVHNFPPNWYAGVEIYSYQLAISLIRLGVEVSVLYPLHQEKLLRAEIEESSFDGIRIFRLLSDRSLPEHGGLTAQVANQEQELLFAEFLRQRNFSAIHFHHTLGMPFSFIDVARKQGVPVCVTLHDCWYLCLGVHLNDTTTNSLCSGPEFPEHCADCFLAKTAITPSREDRTNLSTWIQFRNSQARDALQNVDCIASPSQYLADLHHKYGISRSIEISPLGMNTVRKSRRTTSSPIAFAFLGNIHELKNTYLLAETFKKVTGKARLIYFGDGEKHFIEKLNTTIAGDGRISYQGAYSPSQLPEILDQVDMVVVPSISENYPLVVREALSAGIPVLASRVGGIPEIITHLHNGILFDPNNQDELQKWLQDIADNPSLLDDLKKHIEPVKTIEQDAGEWITRYTQLSSDHVVNRHLGVLSDAAGKADRAPTDYTAAACTSASNPREYGAREANPCPNPQVNITAREFSQTPHPDTAAMDYGSIRILIDGLETHESIAIIERFLQEQPLHAEAHNDLGVLYYRVSNKLQTLGHYEKAVRFCPLNSNFRKNLASFYFVEMGWTMDAIAIYTDILKTDPSDIEALTSLGIISNSIGRPEEARTFFCRVTDLDPLNDEVRKALVDLDPPSSTRMNNVSAELIDMDKSANVSTEELYRKILKLTDDGFIEQAIGDLHRLLLQDTDNALFHNDLAVLYSRTGDAENALFHQEKAVGKAPLNRNYRMNLAGLYYRSVNRIDDAINLYTELLKEKSDDIDTLGALAIISSENDRPEEARIFLNKIVELEPGNIDAHRLLERLDSINNYDFFFDGRPDDATEPHKIKKEFTDCPTGTVTIIIPVYNRLEFTEKCLETLSRNTTAGSYELILVDNGSTDGTADFLQKQEIISKVISNPVNLGFAKACNQGAEVANGLYLVFLNNDTEPQPGWLDALLKTIQANPEIGAVGSKLLYPDSTIQHAGVVIVDDRNIHDPLLGKHIYCGKPSNLPQANIPFCYQALTAASLMISRSAFIDAKGFDECFWNGYEDVDLCFKLRELGYLIVYTPESVVIHHESKSGPERFAKAGQNIDLLHKKWRGKITPDFIITENETTIDTAKGTIFPYKSPNSPPVSEDKQRFPLVSIVILTFNQLGKTKDCIDSIQKHTPELHEIIFIDNGSTDGTSTWLRELCNNNDNYTLIRNKENRGFAAGCNQGIAAAIGEYVLLLNNDVIVTENWLDGLLECLLLTPDGGITGPMTNNISGIQQVPGVQYESVEEIDAFALMFREKNRHRRIPYRRIVGFCMLFRKNLVDAIGLLDENFGSGNFEDDDFCLRAELEGYRNVIAGDVFIHHVGSATFKGNNIDFTSAMTGNRKVFNDKWSRQVRNENEAIKILTLKTLEKAESLYQRGETDKAIDTLLKEGISNASKEHRFYFALADYFIDQERFNDALDSLKELPDSAEGERKYVLLGRALAGMGNLEEAEKLAQLALQNDPSSAPALALSGRIAYDSGRQQEAISLFEAAIKANPGYGEPYTCLGLIALQEDRLEDAVNLLEKGFLYLPISAEAANHYHSLISASGKFDRAEDLFREMHRFYPQHRTLHFLLIDILIRQEKYQQAIAEIEEACTIFGIEDGMLAAGLDLRQKIGPLSVDPKKKKAGTSVSLCMIVKNEEKNLPRCLLSLKPIVDEIIIVDTGSTDRSRTVAELFGAKMLEQPWTGDFSEARNVSLEQATGNWILVMDADEVLAPQDHEQFRQLIKTSTGKRMAFSITTRNYMTKMNAEHWQANNGHYPDQETGGGWVPSDKVRLFSNLKTIRFVDPIHEMVDQSLTQAGIPISKAQIPVHHYGYLDKERQQEKGEQYYLLGIKKLAETGENDCTALSELAIQAGEIGRYAEAVELWSKVLCLAPDLPLAYFNLGFVYLQMGRFTESRDASAKAMKLKRNYYEAVNNYAMAELCLGNFQEASKVLKKTLTAIPEFPNAMAMLAVTRLYANKKDEGLKLFRKLSDNGVNFVEFIHESVKKLISAQRFNEARTILDTALANGYGNEKMHAINTSLQQGQ
ncbi:MAG: glycosyltransferase [Deltaproteobacteria bacterium]|nr:glycosyltransferase [Deltaproteobacteria bacterium]TLN04793.1 MAG: glycosyltransferase [bacterium]